MKFNKYILQLERYSENILALFKNLLKISKQQYYLLENTWLLKLLIKALVIT